MIAYMDFVKLQPWMDPDDQPTPPTRIKKIGK